MQSKQTKQSTSSTKQLNSIPKFQETKNEKIIDLVDADLNVYNQQPFAAELFAKQFIDQLIDEGSKILYDHYLQSKVAQHTSDYMFNFIDDMIRLQFRKCDKKFNDHSEIQEESIPKNHYDAHSTFVINVDKKIVVEDTEPVQLSPVSPQKTQKTFYSTRSKIRPMSSTITEEMTKSKKKKPEHEAIYIPEREQTNDEKNEQHEEQMLRNIYNHELKEKQRKQQQENQRLEEEKKASDIRSKMKQDLDGRNFTYDFNGQPIFFTNRKQNLEQQHIVCPVPYKIKTQKRKEIIDEINECNESVFSLDQKQSLLRNNQFQKQGSIPQSGKASRKQSSNSHISNQDSSINGRSSFDSRSQMEEAVRRKILKIPVVEAMDVPIKERTIKQQQSLSPKSKKKKDDISDDIYNNGNQRQTSMIPFMTLRDGVKLTEFQNGKEVTKVPEQNVCGEQEESKKKMTRNEYFKMIEDQRYQGSSFKQQMNTSRNGCFTQRSDIKSRDAISQDKSIKDETQTKQQRIKSLLSK